MIVHDVSDNRRSRELGRLHAEADALLTQKANGITEMNQFVEDAEQKPVILKVQSAVKMK
jgi:hypothetical protein